ncbi:MAG: metallophosphoesterase family protein [Oscillospiraceae bacterium]
MTIKIGVISDTHGLLRPEVLDVLYTCDAILHSGDADKPEILDFLRPIAPLYVVRGNNDREWARYIPHSLSFSLGDVNFFMIHDKSEIPKALGDRQIVVFGHSHRYFEQMVNDRLWLNPGSCGKPRFHQELSMAIVRIDNGHYQVEKIPIEP